MVYEKDSTPFLFEDDAEGEGDETEEVEKIADDEEGDETEE